MYARSLAALAAISLALATPCLAVGERAPVVDVQGRRGAGFGAAAGVSGAFFGEVDGQRYLFKSNAPIRSHFGLVRHTLTGNVEGEWLSSRLMRAAGVASPEVDVVRLRRPRRHSYARIQHMQDLFPGQELVRGMDAVKGADRIDMRAVHRVQAMDLLLGNADRHLHNMWFVRDRQSGLLRPVAFDHNVALGTRQGFTGTRQPTNWSALELGVTHLAPDGTRLPTPITQEVLRRNPAYQASLWHPGELGSLHDEARHVQRTLTEERIRTLVAEIPDDAIAGPDKAARRAELEEHLLRRRRQLVPAVEAYMRQHPAYQQAMWELGRLPEDVRGRIPEDMRTRWALVESLGPDGKFDRARLRRTLGIAGVTAPAVLAVHEGLSRQGLYGVGGVGPAGDGQPRSWGEVRGTRDPFRGRTPGFEGLEYTVASGGGEHRALDGQRLTMDADSQPVSRRRAAQVADAVVAGGAAQEGDRVRVRRRQGLLAGYDAEVVSRQGEVVERGRYHTVGRSTVGVTRSTGGHSGARGRLEASTGISQERSTDRASLRPSEPGPLGRRRPRVRVKLRGRW